MTAMPFHAFMVSIAKFKALKALYGLFRAGQISKGVAVFRALGMSATGAATAAKWLTLAMRPLGAVFGMLAKLPGVRQLGMGLLWLKNIVVFIGRSLLTTVPGFAVLAVAALLIYKYWQPIKAFFAGLWEGLKQGLAPIAPMFEGLSGVFSGLWSTIQPFVQPIIDWFTEFFSITQAAEGGVRSFGESVGLWIGEKISAVVSWITERVEAIKTAFDGGLAGIGALILNWSPVGLFYQAFAAVMDYFGIEMPANLTGFISAAINALSNLIMTWSPVTAFMTAFQAVWSWLSGLGAIFTAYGSQMIDGLVNGIKAGVGRAVEAVQGVVSMVKSAFTSDRKGMAIHSPSRVFMRYGGFITEGLSKGLQRGAAGPVSSIGGMANQLKQRFSRSSGRLSADLSAEMSANAAEFAQARQQRGQETAAATAANGSITINFNPTIHAPGGDTAQIQTALQMGLREFEELFRRMMADRERRAY
ncbi:phage tail protein [Neisseria animalis]|uniref:Phage tail tape measure protein n=1 Tax=Neisseria animalis TaxID=492 RepID=A0A5P3MPU0_NEIAN|nr:hypothetical protein [Neisseria animalis]QEY23554.1 hypothetical protein D0T90_02750 [Neisseria animalis]ROW32154.1 hypothetical protein CGZ60_06130 [Neisseria animalis]VEE09204.1 putative phage-related tail protein [Neisseria animalis]